MNKSLQLLAQKMTEQQLTLALAESCTGGLFSNLITDLNGASQWFDRAYITYSNQAKIDMLSVKAATLARYGAVSEAVAVEMAQGALNVAKVSRALSITGIAGPTGGSKAKPVGTVCFGLAAKNQPVKSAIYHFEGSRQSVRLQSVTTGIQILLESIP